MGILSLIFMLFIASLGQAKEASMCIAPDLMAHTNSIDNLFSDINLAVKECEEIYELLSTLEGIDKGKIGFNIPSSPNISHKLLKLFTKKGTDQWINLYAICGGKSSEGEFLKNLILMEAYNSCIYPNPPGFLTAAETNNIAEKIANQYADLSLAKMSKKSSEILNNTYHAFIEKVIRGNFEMVVEKDELDTYLNKSPVLLINLSSLASKPNK